jgi:para-nitrobenzyl esterase
VLEISVTGGTLRGTRTREDAEGDLCVFRGIPFASLPVRLGAPCPVEAWDGVRDATTFGPPPPQSGAFGTDEAGAGGEDWLTLNVWSPDLAGNLPVMVWIQGGGYLFGTSGLPEYDGSALAHGGVVLVTFNYRVGFEGFGYVEGHPLNRGLLDQVAALRWVRENIAAFGGDPDRVTVFGQSAGGGSVAALLAMPRAEGLFVRAIAQSVPTAFFTPALAADVARACADELGVAPADLLDVDPDLLVLAGDTVLEGIGRFASRWGLAADAGIPFAPVLDGDVLPALPWAGTNRSVDLLVGHTRDEQRLLSVVSGVRGEITAELAARNAELFAPDPAAYRARFSDPEDLYEVVRSDWLFRMPSVHLADTHLRAGGSTFLYELTWSAPAVGEMFGACHGLDVPLVFGNLDLGQPAILIGEVTAEARAVSEQMRQAWIAFATTGDPGWASYDTGAVRIFDATPAVGPYPESWSRHLWAGPPDVLDVVG